MGLNRTEEVQPK